VHRPFLDQHDPIAFAHRGGALEAPENTLAAFDAALALGYRYLETDAHLTADGVVVAIHDAALERVTDRTGRVERLTLAEIQPADAGYSFTPDAGRTHPFRGRGLRVPTLAELLDRWPSARWNIDAKTDHVVPPLVETLRRHDALARVCIGSFSDRRLARVRALAAGGVCTSMGQMAVSAAYFASRSGRMPRLGADCVQVPPRWRGVTVVDARFIRAAHRAGLPVHAWTIDDEPAMARLLDLGVDGVMTDRPRVLRDLLVTRRQWVADGERAGPVA
jgi:glycerophosphoryl diester phosphodiesterase